MSDQLYFCPGNMTSCYYYLKTTAAYSAQKTICQNMGGYLVAYNSGWLASHS